MLRRLLLFPPSSAAAAAALLFPEKLLSGVSIGAGSLQRDHVSQISFRRHFIDLYKIVDKEAIKKEKSRLNDELSRGYFADIAEIRANSGKVSDGSSLELPLSEQNVSTNSAAIVPSVSLYCLSFRASSQRMTESWSTPFLDAFDSSSNVKVYEVSLIDSWLLSLNPVKNLFLKIAKSSSDPRRRSVYSFGDHYDFRKKLQIINLLTGYIFLVDSHGRIRWQGFGTATLEELSSLVTATSLLLEEK